MEFNIRDRSKSNIKILSKSCSSRNVNGLKADNSCREVTTKLKNHANNLFAKLPNKQNNKIKELK